MDAYIRASDEGLVEWANMKADDRPNLREKMNHINSPRHADYVDVDVYRRKLADVRETFGRPDPSHESYDSLRSDIQTG